MSDHGGECKLEGENSLLERHDEAVSAFLHDGVAAKSTALAEYEVGAEGAVLLRVAYSLNGFAVSPSGRSSDFDVFGTQTRRRRVFEQPQTFGSRS